MGISNRSGLCRLVSPRGRHHAVDDRQNGGNLRERSHLSGRIQFFFSSSLEEKEAFMDSMRNTSSAGVT